MCIQLLGQRIEGLRSEMIRVAEDTGSLSDPQVIELSQQLDQLLVVMQRLKKHAPRSAEQLYRQQEADLYALTDHFF